MLTRMSQMFTGPVGPVEVFFTGPKLFWGISTGPGPVVHCKHGALNR